MENGRGIARVASLFGDPSRAEILLALLGGQALTASELAQIASVTKQTVSAHVAKLLEAGLVAREIQGRHRYFRLAGRDVSRLLESLMGVADRSGAVRARVGPRDPALRKARVCYDHLAGELGVLVFESLDARACLRSACGGLDLTPAGRRCFAALGIDVASLASARRPLCRACLDWSARRPHLAGSLGAALLERIFALGWARRARRSRVVHFSALGEGALRRAFPAPER
ncbi:MAG: helix-turn-helix domain-containing protein [Myxococcota bacterium]